VGGIDAISTDFLKLKWKIGKLFTDHDIQRDRLLPDPKLFESPIKVFSIHEVSIY
jgi:hypothetical protein